MVRSGISSQILAAQVKSKSSSKIDKINKINKIVKNKKIMKKECEIFDKKLIKGKPK
jgi:enolase